MGEGRTDTTSAADSTGTVLFIDDEEVILTFTQDVLGKFGFKVLTAPSGKEGVEVFRRNSEAIDVIVLDARMPDMNGEDTFHALRAILPDVPIILSSGYDGEDCTQRLFEQGLTDFIRKPYRLTQLVNLLKKLLRDR